MTTVNEAIRPYAESFKALETSRATGEPDWLIALRRSAFDHFVEHGFPAARSENWKYTPTRPLEKRAFTSMPPVDQAPALKAIQPALLKNTTQTVFFQNGRYAPELGSSPAQTNGLRIRSLRETLQEDANNLESSLTPEVKWKDDTFTALNTAFLQDGVVIELEDGLKLEQPLQLVFVSTPQAQATACYPRILLKLGAGARATLVETWLGLDDAANFANSYAQISLAEGAILEHLRLQREAREEFHVSRIAVEQHEESCYISHTLNFGGRWIRNDLHTCLEGSGAETQFNGLYLTRDRQHVDNHTRVDHLVPGTRSDELYRGIIDGHSHAVFNGKVVVARHAVQTDAAQANHNLLLSRDSEIDTKPELEIYADDVKCSHGATVGQLDESALFYLRSRGLSLEDSRGLLVGAFANSVLDRITSPVLRTFAREQLMTVLPQSAALEST